MKAEFITNFFKNTSVSDIVITNKNGLYQITAGDYTVTNVSFLDCINEIYKLLRYDPLKITIADYMTFITNARLNKKTFEPFYSLDSTCIPPSIEELKEFNIEFVKSIEFYANGMPYKCKEIRYSNGSKIDYSVYKWLYSMAYDESGDCIIQGVLNNDI